MNKKLQVFVSSTYTDLIEERQTAVQAILDAGHIPAGMELFKAGKSQMKTIRKWIDESDVYMLILGGRYDSIEEESGLSYTELEYKYALSKNMPVFAIVLEDSFLFTKAAIKGRDAIFEKNNIRKYNDFKFLVESNIVRFASNTDKIASDIHSQLNSLLLDEEYTLTGWIRNEHTIISVNDIDQILYFTLPFPQLLYKIIKMRNIRIKELAKLCNINPQYMNSIIKSQRKIPIHMYNIIMSQLDLSDLERKFLDYSYLYS